MPNNCYNELEICGDVDDVERVFGFIRSDVSAFDFNRVIPYPDRYAERDGDHARLIEQLRSKFVRDWSWRDVMETPEVREFIEKWGALRDGYNSGGYEWCKDNWGTKWNAYKVKRLDNRLFFYTAWVPPIPIIQELARKFPMCSFHLEYFERAMGFCGGVSFLGKHDHCDSRPFVAGEKCNEWLCKDYLGAKGG